MSLPQSYAGPTGDLSKERGPIFIGGPDRCGKTTLSAFLTSHPNISIAPVGSNMWSYFYGQHGPLRRPANFERCLAAMLRYKHVLVLKPDPARIRREFWQGDPSYARLFELFQQHYAERVGKPRWGDQTGLIERYADLVFAAYPAARMIQLMRDPRDRYEASLALWPKGKGRAGGASARWLYSARLAARNLKRHPERYKIVRFENLVRQPEGTLREVCSFLGEAYVPAMLSMDGVPERRDKIRCGANLGPGPSPLSAEFIGRFRQAVPKREIAFLQAAARRYMPAYGYLPEPVKLSPQDLLRFYLVDWPANQARLMAWLGLESLQQNLPGLMGRKPSAETLV
jgi:hypothetical protein